MYPNFVLLPTDSLPTILNPNRLLPYPNKIAKTLESSEGLVLFLDIMGFKDKVLRTPHKELGRQLRRFKSKHTKLKPLMKMEAKVKREKKIEIVQFSDSIIAVAHRADMFTLNRLVKIASILMQIGLESNFAMKGAIAMGDVTFDSENQLYYGQAIVDAYLMEEELKFYGVAFHHTVEKLVEDALQNCFYPDGTSRRIYYPIQKCDIPLKTCKCKHYCIAWQKLSQQLNEGDISEEALGWLDNLNKTVSGSPRIYVDNTIDIIHKTNLEPIPKIVISSQQSSNLPDTSSPLKNTQSDEDKGEKIIKERNRGKKTKGGKKIKKI